MISHLFHPADRLYASTDSDGTTNLMPLASFLSKMSMAFCGTTDIFLISLSEEHPRKLYCPISFTFSGISIRPMA